MKVPDLWLMFGEHIHQDFMIDYPDFFSGITETLKNFSTEQKQELLLFLQDLLSANISSDKKLDTWLASEADIFVTTDQIDDFLRQLAKAVEDDLGNSN